MSRQNPIDALKFFASQVIFFHHFSAYGPLAEALHGAMPSLMSWLYDFGRMAVQVFLVIGGFLAAKQLAFKNATSSTLLTLSVNRYLRLAPPFIAALLITMVCSFLAALWLESDFIPSAPTWTQFFAHVFLLHSVLGADSLSAGVWYVAIDFQLYLLLAMLLSWKPAWGKWLALSLMLASLFVFNLIPDFDNWAVYFFGAYALGAAAYWAAMSERPLRLLVLLGAVGLLPLAVDFRSRIGLALCVALALGAIQWRQTRMPQSPNVLDQRASHHGLLRVMGDMSYSLFLLHFSVLLLGNALFAELDVLDGANAFGVLGACWAVSMTLAFFFRRWVELPLSRLHVA